LALEPNQEPDDGGTTARPALRRLHGNATVTQGNRLSYRYWSSKSTQEIVDSLRPGSKEPLLVKRDGTVMQGNTRTLIFEQRGVDAVLI
jgi:hypothetical protein